MAETHVELTHPDVDEVLEYDDADTPARQAYIEVLEASGWKKRAAKAAKSTKAGDD